MDRSPPPDHSDFDYLLSVPAPPGPAPPALPPLSLPSAPLALPSLRADPSAPQGGAGGGDDLAGGGPFGGAVAIGLGGMPAPEPGPGPGPGPAAAAATAAGDPGGGNSAGTCAGGGEDEASAAGRQRGLEEKRARERKRILRNRELARVSNERRKGRIKAMENDLVEARAKVGSLEDNIRSLEAENKQLKILLCEPPTHTTPAHHRGQQPQHGAPHVQQAGQPQPLPPAQQLGLALPLPPAHLPRP